MPLSPHQMVSGTGLPTVILWIVPIFTLYEGYQGQAKCWFMFNVQKQPFLVSGGASLAQKLHLYTRTASCQGGRKSAGHVSTHSTYPKKGSMEEAFMMCNSQHLHHLHLMCGFVLLQNILEQWRSLTFSIFVFVMVKGLHLHLRCHSPLFQISHGLILQLLWLIIPLSRRGWMNY